MNYRISEFCAAIALAQFEKVDEKVNIRRDIAKLYDNVFKKYENFIPQEVPEGYVHSYFTYSVKSPFKKLEDWKKFYKFHTTNNGDTFCAMMATVYKEKIMQDLGYDKECSGSCPITEEIQPRCILFKTNYRNLTEAKKNIDILEKKLKVFFG